MQSGQSDLVLGKLADFNTILGYMLNSPPERCSPRLVERMTRCANRLMADMSSRMQPGDELRFCRSLSHGTTSFYGDDGLAIVRESIIIEYQLVREYS